MMRFRKYIFYGVLLLICGIFGYRFMWERIFPVPHLQSSHWFLRHVSENEPPLLELYGFYEGWWLYVVRYRKDESSEWYDSEMFIYSRCPGRVDSIFVYPLTNGCPIEAVVAELKEGKNAWYLEDEPFPIINRQVFESPEYKKALYYHSDKGGHRE